MTIKTTQVSAEDALRAVADGKLVQMVWTNAGEPMFLNFNQKLANVMQTGDAFLIMEISDTCENATENCENAAEEVPETIVTDPDTTPVTVEIPNSKKAEKERWRKVDDEMIIKLRKDGLSEMKIALELDTTQPTVHSHIQKLKKEGRL